MTNGIIALNALQKYNKPVFVAIGENDLRLILQVLPNFILKLILNKVLCRLAVL